MKSLFYTLLTTLVSCYLCLGADRKPNIVVIFADDLGWFDTRFQGNTDLETPFLDQFAKEGMIFPNGYSASPVCTPARAALMTGMSPARLGITNHAPGHKEGMIPEGRKLAGAKKLTYLPLEATTIAERLKQEADYATGFVGKWHLSHRKGQDSQGNRYEPQLRPEHQGFDINIGGCDRGGPPSYFEPYRIPALSSRKEGEYLPTRMADECITFIDANRDKPFFLSFWNYSVHYPIEAPQDLIDKYKKRGIKNPAYAAMIEGMDRSIGRVLQAIDKDPELSANTLVIFTSDNGSLFGNGPLRANKGYLYEGGIRVPWLIRWPGKIQPGSQCEEPIITTDIFPTMLEVAGLAAKADMPVDGTSLVPLFSEGGELDRKSLYFHYPNYAFHKRNRLGSAIRTGDFKLIQWYDGEGELELYNLAEDLGEKKNLANDMPEKAKAMAAELKARLESVGAKMPY